MAHKAFIYTGDRSKIILKKRRWISALSYLNIMRIINIIANFSGLGVYYSIPREGKWGTTPVWGLELWVSKSPLAGKKIQSINYHQDEQDIWLDERVHLALFTQPLMRKGTSGVKVRWTTVPLMRSPTGTGKVGWERLKWGDKEKKTLPRH